MKKCRFFFASALTVFLATLAFYGVRPPLAQASPPLQAGPTELVYGETVDGQLGTDTPSAFYVFQAQTGDIVTITMISPDATLDPFLVLNDEAGTPLATDDNSGGGSAARLTFVIPETGRYEIQATNAGGDPAGDGANFSLNLTAAVDVAPSSGEGTIPANPPLATLQSGDGHLLKLTPGTSLRNTLDRESTLRLYWFQGEVGYQIDLQPDATSAFQPVYVLYDSGFTELARAEPGEPLRSLLPQTGLYFLTVSLPDAGSPGGDYSFLLNETSPTQNPGYIDIAYGESLRGTIDTTTPAVTYRFRGVAGTTVTIQMDNTGGDLDSYLYLLDGSNQLLYEDNDSGGQGNAKILYTLPADGVYLITATRMGQGQGTTTGSYTLQLESDTPASGITPSASPTVPPDYADFPTISYGDSVEGEISNSKYLDAYVFWGQEGNAIVAEMTSLNKDDPNGLDPLLILLDDQRIPLIENDDIVDGVERDSRVVFTLPQTGFYAIVATRFDQAEGASEGPYQLTLVASNLSSTQETPTAALAGT